MVFGTVLLLLVMIAIHSVHDSADALPVDRKRSYSRRSSRIVSIGDTANWDDLGEETNSLEKPESNLFSNVLLSYDKNKDQDEREEKSPSDLIKSWLGRKFQQLVASREDQESDEESSKEVDQDIVELTVPRSPNRNEIFMPIDFNLLLPKESSSSTGNGHFEHLQNSSQFDDLVAAASDSESDSQHVYVGSPNDSYETSVDDEHRSHAYFEQEDNNVLDSQQLRNDLNFGYRSANQITTQRPSTTTSSTTSTTTIKSTTTLDYRNISYDLPERRFLMTYPVRRLLMAYFAPRILRFQMAMILNSVIGEVSRKIFDPLIGSRFGFGSNSASKTAATPSAAPAPSSQLSLAQLAQSLSPLSSLSSLSGLTQQLTAGNQNKNSQLQSSPASSSSSSSSSPLTSLLSSAISGNVPGGPSQAMLNTLLGQLSDADMKQMMEIAGLGQGSSSGGVGGGVGVQQASGLTGTSAGVLPSTVDYDEAADGGFTGETETGEADLTPT